MFQAYPLDMLGITVFVPTLVILIFAKLNAAGFNILWRYFAWSNQTLAVFAFAMITVYLIHNRKNCLVALIPGTFYCLVITSYILNAQIGFRLPLTISLVAGAVLTVAYVAMTLRRGKTMTQLENHA